jgi:hypothetical protein
MIKDVHGDVYERVMAGEAVKVRKSVKPVYEFLRSEYQNYLSHGIESVALEFTPTPNPLKEKYELI